MPVFLCLLQPAVAFLQPPSFFISAPVAVSPCACGVQCIEKFEVGVGLLLLLQMD